MTTKDKRSGGGQEARKRKIADGGRQINITLTAEDNARLQRLVDYHESNMAAVIKHLIRTADAATNYKK